jgi:hypothetical protein
MMILTITMLIAAAVYRLMPAGFHPYNLAPLGAMALMGGMYFGRRFALWVPLAVLAVTDLALNSQAGYPLFFWPRLIDYGAFVLIGLMGLWARDRRLTAKFGAAVSTPFLFYVISNFGVWLTGLNLANQPYPKTMAGLLECYAAGLPFLRGTLFGDYLFIGLFAGIAVIAARTADGHEPVVTPELDQSTSK